MKSKHIIFLILGILLLSGLSFALNCGDTITTNTVLTANLGPCSGDGLVMGANNIVLDCDGHSIQGTKTTGSSGVYANIKTNLTIKNCVINDFDYGMQPRNTRNSIVTNNILSDNTHYGFLLVAGRGNLFDSNTVSGSSIGPAFALALSSFNNFTNNTAFGNYEGISLTSRSSNNRVIGNSIYDNSGLGIYIYDGSNNTVLTDNTLYNDGLIITLSSNSNLTDNTLSGVLIEDSSDNTRLVKNTASSITIQTCSNTLLQDNVVNGSTGTGLYLRSGANNVTVLNDHYDNGRDFLVNGTGISVSLSEVIFDNAAGDYDYTILSLNDIVTSPYSIRWDTAPATMPAGRVSFWEKFIRITPSGAVSIDSITWHWLDNESTGYDESKFELWKYNASGWTNTGATLDTGANTLSLSNLEPNSVYGILYKVLLNYGTIHAVVTTNAGGGGQEPMPNAPVRAYDKAGCAAAYIPKSNDLVADESCQPDASCTTDADGLCDMHVSAGDYFVLVKVLDNSGKYPGHTVADVMPGETKLARLAFKVGSDWVWILIAVLAILGGMAFLYSKRTRA